MSRGGWEIGLTRWSSLLGRDLQRAARRAGGPERLWAASAPELGALLRISPVQARRLMAQRAGRSPTGGHVARRDPRYPGALAAIADPPFVLFCRGGQDQGLRRCRTAPSVAIVGSRRAQDRSRTFARDLAADLARRGVVIVSGLARGVDAAAHRGALDAGGTTVAVLGSGADTIYPRSNAGLAEAITREGGSVVSEYWPGTRPAPWRFPARNRIIAGLAQAVVVVEAAERSGSLITADFALEGGRAVLATPGAPWSERFRGCNALIRAGAALCEGVDDVIVELPPQMAANLLSVREAEEPEQKEGE